MSLRASYFVDGDPEVLESERCVDVEAVYLQFCACTINPYTLVLVIYNAGVPRWMKNGEECLRHGYKKLMFVTEFLKYFSRQLQVRQAISRNGSIVCVKQQRDDAAQHLTQTRVLSDELRFYAVDVRIELVRRFNCSLAYAKFLRKCSCNAIPNTQYAYCGIKCCQYESTLCDGHATLKQAAQKDCSV